MSKGCTCPGVPGTNRMIKMNCPVHGIDRIAEDAAPKLLNRIDGYYHVSTCKGKCGVPFGCAPHWQPDELARMEAHGYEPKSVVNRTDQAEAPPRPLREKTSAERKAEPVHSGVVMYFPDALAAIARLSKSGNEKHNPGEPLHWARGKSTDQMDALTRHTMTRDKVDPETGELEAVAMAWRALAELQLLEEKRLLAWGVMPYSGVVS